MYLVDFVRYLAVSLNDGVISSSVWRHAPLEFHSISGLFSSQLWPLPPHLWYYVYKISPHVCTFRENTFKYSGY